MNHDVKNPGERLIIALDYATADEALRLVRSLNREVGWFKIGLQLYTAEGPEILRAVAATGAKIFLDLKLHDIPNTVSNAVAAARALGVSMLTLHLSGGARMVEGAVAAAGDDLLLLGVTVLTSSDEATLRETGVASGVEEQTIRLARLGLAAGIRGLVASPQELRGLRSAVGEHVRIVTPGVRPVGAAADDQKRFTTPAEALRNGADYLVMGRPVTANPDPVEALRQIVREIS